MDIVFFVVAFLAEIVGTIAGFGSAMILLPVALFFFDFKTALVLVAFMHLFGNLGRITFFFRGLSWRPFIYFGLIGLPCTVFGAMLVTRMDQKALEAGLGIFLVAYGLFSLLKPTFRMKQTRINMLAGGAASGFLAGLIGTGGALRSAFLTAYKMPKARYVGTAAALAIVVDGARIPPYLKDGLLSGSYYWMLPVLFVLAIAGSYSGKRLVKKIPQRVFSKIVLGCLVLAGTVFIAGYFRN